MSHRLPIRAPGSVIAVLSALCLTSCLIAPPDPASTPADAIVQIHGSGGEELGVATDYGIVFLGHTQRGGTVEYTAWYGDGPSPESGLVEPIGGGLFVTEPELAVHRSAIDFRTPKPGTRVRVVVRKGRGVREFAARVVAVEGAEGLFLAPNGELTRLGATAVGAGIFLDHDASHALIGLLSGELELT
ncbi:MAG TPA: hypothetical protein ENJ09_07050, partial [Planctomycetes bacterium]|nr:hypothetical protein [Planctomycetota bacterium]